MANLRTDHLLDQADRLAAPPQQGRPRQADLRRAISAAYYAIFHLIINAAADEIVGANASGGAEYGLVQRSVDHGSIKALCVDLSKATPPQRFQPYLPSAIGNHLRGFMAIFPNLQEARHAADYDSRQAFKVALAKGLIATARQALQEWTALPQDERKLFLFLLLFPPKR